MTNFNTKYQSVCGIDIAKNVIQIYQVNQDGECKNFQVKRKEFLQLFENREPSLIGNGGLRQLPVLGARTTETRPHSKFNGPVCCKTLRFWLQELPERRYRHFQRNACGGSKSCC